MTSTAGRLLIASPLIGDPNFDRSVILMIEHSDEGALGVVLNNPSDTAVAEMLPDWAPLATGPSVFFFGGPVSPESVIGLGRMAPGTAPADEGTQFVVGNVTTIDLHLTPDSSAGHIEQVRLFAGYSGWGPGQLDAELALDAWFVVDADDNDVFNTEPGELWSFVFARQPGPMSWLANYPIDPSLN